MTMTKGGNVAILEGAAQLLARYDVIFCDVWGVLHNGLRAYAPAGDALARFRAAGGTVVLVSNSPARSSSLATLLDRVGVRRDAWDAAVTSGDLTRTHLTERGYRRIFHIGSPGDTRVFAGLDIELVELKRAAAVVCTAPFDYAADADACHRSLLTEALARSLPFVCGNPDLVVDVDGELYICAGTVAQLYETMGGKVYWAGKPHRPAYEAAHKLAPNVRGRDVSPERILAIGDAVRTDLAGAAQYGVDCLLVADGIHRDQLLLDGRVDAAQLGKLLDGVPHRPVGVIPALVW